MFTLTKCDMHFIRVPRVKESCSFSRLWHISFFVSNVMIFFFFFFDFFCVIIFTEARQRTNCNNYLFKLLKNRCVC